MPRLLSPALVRRRLAHPAEAAREATQSIEHHLETLVGGPARMRVVILLACVLGLENADQTAIGAAAPQLEASLHVSNAAIGLIAAIATFVGAIGTIPAGVLTDRVRRVNLLIGALALWAVAMCFSAAASSYEWLLISRIGLGAVTAAAGPIVASLTGDFFAPSERGKIYGYILSGELLGAGFGFVVAGSVAGALSWRGAFAVLVIPAVVLAYFVWRKLPEPRRGRFAEQEENSGGDSVAREQVKAKHVDPVRANVLREDPLAMSLPRAVRYVLRIRTNVWLIAASSVGYFFFAGLRTFGLSYTRGHFHVAQATGTIVLFLAGTGALGGVLFAGRLADRLVRRGHVSARVLVGAVAYVVSALVLVPGLLASSVAAAIPLLMVGAACLSAPNAPLDAARLDIMPSRLWGRAEGVRTLIRQSAQAVSPLLFGVVADALAGTHGSALGASSSGMPTAATTHGLQITFLIMLVPLALSGGMLLLGRRRYPRDVATAVVSERELRADPGRPRSGRASELVHGRPPRPSTG